MCIAAGFATGMLRVRAAPMAMTGDMQQLAWGTYVTSPLPMHCWWHPRWSSLVLIPEARRVWMPRASQPRAAYGRTPATVTQQRLLRSGDVERNPGPSSPPDPFRPGGFLACLNDVLDQELREAMASLLEADAAGDVDDARPAAGDGLAWLAADTPMDPYFASDIGFGMTQTASLVSGGEGGFRRREHERCTQRVCVCVSRAG